MGAKLAVMLIHGAEINSRHFADSAIRLLQRSFQEQVGVDSDDALVIKTAFWKPVLDATHDQLLDSIGGTEANSFFRTLSEWGTSIDAGSGIAMAKLLASGFLRRLPWARDFHFPTLRWLTVHYIGDVVAYQINSSDRVLYDEVHAVVAETMHDLAAEAGKDAPLCVIAHSLGTVIASNFFYDLEVESGCFGDHRSLVPERTKRRLGDSPLERGETLNFLYTLGSPIALWAGRLPDCGTPVIVPHPKAARHNPNVSGEWVNIFDPDDVAGAPLKNLNALYHKQITEDRTTAVGPWWLSWTPLSHPWYWNSPLVLEPIAKSLAQAWQATAGANKRPRGRTGWQDRVPESERLVAHGNRL
jgi:hypothetical protein